MQSMQLADYLVPILRETVVNLVREEGPDLSARQLAVLLICYLSDEPQTVRGLAVRLQVVRSAITRVLDRLGEVGLVRRKTDPMDRRSVLVQRTVKGSAFVSELRRLMADAARNARPVCAMPESHISRAVA